MIAIGLVPAMVVTRKLVNVVAEIMLLEQNVTNVPTDTLVHLHIVKVWFTDFFRNTTYFIWKSLTGYNLFSNLSSRMPML